MKKMKFLLLLLLIALSLEGCSGKKGVRYLRTPLSRNSSIAVIIDSPNNIKNVVMVKFLKKGFRVKAVNASDLYTLENLFDIEDLKYLAYQNSEESFWEDIFSSDLKGINSKEKTFNNLFKLHVYNYESHKAEILSELSEKWNVRYLVVLELKDWQEVSWGRAIDLNSYDLIWLENYPTKNFDNLDTVVDHFITSLTRR